MTVNHYPPPRAHKNIRNPDTKNIPKTKTLKDEEKMTTTCVIFDLDGVLVDSVDAWIKIHRNAAKKFIQNPPPDEELDKLVWAPTSLFIDRLLPKDAEKRGETAKRMHSYIHKSMENLISSSYVKEQEGSKELLKRLKQENKKIGLVTNNERRIAEKMINRFKLQGFFDTTVTKDDVENTKPHPEPILKALKRLRCKPENCLYIGDNEEDVNAGKAAGVTTILLNTTRNREQVKTKTRPDHTINKLDEIPTLINQ